MSDATSAVDVRDAEPAEVDALAEIWYVGWQDAHAAILPATLARARTPERFRERLAAGLAAVRATGPVQAPTGFCMTKGAELYQLFVARPARGTGAAAALVADAERRIEAGGADIAWLDCAIGNQRAARFYEKCGWRRTGTVTSELATPDEIVTIEVWRYEKVLRGASETGAQP